MHDEDDFSIFSKNVEPWHENAVWGKIMRRTRAVDGVYCKLLECRQKPKRQWDNPDM